MNKKQQFLAKVDGHEAANDYVPVGFWFHFLENELHRNYFEEEQVFDQNVVGHHHYSAANHPDFIKLMSDGFFVYPDDRIKNTASIAEIDLADLKPIAKSHPWITKQVELVQQQIAGLTEEVATFYNIFAPATYFKFLFADGNQRLADDIAADPLKTKKLLDVMAESIANLTEAVIAAGGATGIYLSVQNVQDERVDAAEYGAIIQNSDLIVVKRAKQLSAYHILHICGYEGSKNDLSLYKDYDFPIVNWAVHIEGFSLAEGKAYFQDKVVLGGFDNRPDGLLASGSEQDIKAYAQNLVAKTGTDRLIVGADCTLPFGVDYNRIKWVQEALN